MLRIKSVLVATSLIWACSACAARADLIGYWSLNGNANDASAYANNGTGANVTYTSDVPTAIAGHVSTSAYLNGTSSKVTVGSSTSLYANSAVTISFWMKATAGSQAGGYRRVFSNLASGKYGMEFQENGTGTAIQLRIDTSTTSGSGSNQLTTIGNAFDGNWHFIAITADSSGTLTTYYDGVASSHSFLYNSGFGSTSAVCFGNSMNESSDWLLGNISDMAMWNTVLTSAQITSLYNGTATPLTLAVPEPATTVMALTGAAGLLAFAWRRRRRKVQKS